MTETERPADQQPERLSIGVIVAPHGIRGEVKMQVWTHFPKRIPELRSVFLEGEDQPRRVRRARLSGNIAILKLEGFNDRDEAETLRGKTVRITLEQAAPLEEGEYYHFQLINLAVQDEAGHSLGQLAEIIETGANDVYLVRSDEGKELLLPALESVILKVDLAAGTMTVRPPDYLES